MKKGNLAFAAVCAVIGLVIIAIANTLMCICGFAGIRLFSLVLKVPKQILTPAILGLILGPMAEKNFRTALLKSGGDPTVFFSTVICWFFIALILFTLLGGRIKSLLFKKKAAR